MKNESESTPHQPDDLNTLLCADRVLFKNPKEPTKEEFKEQDKIVYRVLTVVDGLSVDDAIGVLISARSRVEDFANDRLFLLREDSSNI